MNKHRQTTSRKAPEGIAVLFSLLITSLVTLIGLGISYIIIKELNLSGNIDSATRAYYAADSGVEKGLQRIKYGRENNHLLSDIIADIQSYASTFTSGAGSVYTNEDTNSTNGIDVDSLAENQSAQADYTQPNPPLVGAVCSTGGSCVDSWLVEWDYTDPLSNATGIEVTFIGWDPEVGSVIVEPETQKIIKTVGGVGENGERIINLPVTQNLYRLRIKVLGSDSDPLVVEALKDLKVTAYNMNDPLDPSAVMVPSTSSITIKAKGTRGQLSQAITATVPWLAPLSGIFDYVIFSEDALSKINPVVTNPPIYRSGKLEVEQGVGGGLCSCVSPEVPACGSTGWQGGCDAGGSSLQGARCNEPGNVNFCSVSNIVGGGQNAAGLYVLPNITSLGFPSGEYYVRIQGKHTGTPARVQLDDEWQSAGTTPYVDSFMPPTAASCTFNCLFATPIKLGKFCSGGDNNGKSCTVNADCPNGGTCGSAMTKLFLLSENDTISGKKTYLDWYSISSSPLLTGPSDKYCNAFTVADCQ